MRKKPTHVLWMHNNRTVGYGSVPRVGEDVYVRQDVKWPNTGTPYVEGVVVSVMHFYYPDGKAVPEVRASLRHGDLTTARGPGKVTP